MCHCGRFAVCKQVCDRTNLLLPSSLSSLPLFLLWSISLLFQQLHLTFTWHTVVLSCGRGDPRLLEKIKYVESLPPVTELVVVPMRSSPLFLFLPGRGFQILSDIDGGQGWTGILSEYVHEGSQSGQGEVDDTRSFSLAVSASEERSATSLTTLPFCL